MKDRKYMLYVVLFGCILATFMICLDALGIFDSKGF